MIIKPKPKTLNAPELTETENVFSEIVTNLRSLNGLYFDLGVRTSKRARKLDKIIEAIQQKLSLRSKASSSESSLKLGSELKHDYQFARATLDEMIVKLENELSDLKTARHRKSSLADSFNFKFD